MDTKYRTEAFSGTGERDAVKVMAFETFELENTDILEYLAENVLCNHPLAQECRSMAAVGPDRNTPFEEQHEFFRRILAAVNEATGRNIRYVLWLADLDAVQDREWYGRDMVDDSDYDEYEVGPVIFSDLGYDGALYGYEQMPEAVSRQ